MKEARAKPMGGWPEAEVPFKCEQMRRAYRSPGGMASHSRISDKSHLPSVAGEGTTPRRTRSVSVFPLIPKRSHI